MQSRASSGQPKVWTGLVMAVCGVAAATGGGPAEACSTPVHRYALYRWPATPYAVFYFYEAGDAGEEVVQEDVANKEILRRAEDEKSPSNLELVPVDVSDEEKLDQYPEPVLLAWRERGELEPPFHAIFTPFGKLLHRGRLTVKDVTALADSPARRDIAGRLSGKNDGVLVFVPGPDEEENRLVLHELQGAVEAAPKELGFFAAPPYLEGEGPGMPEFPGGEPVAPGETPEGPAAEIAPTGPQVGVVTVSRSDPEEAWLVKMLLSVDELEPDDLEHAMLFALYGRGRALMPFIGKGIEKLNILGDIAFVNGPCSCMVKDQNPGMDLVFAWNWDEAALTVAEKVGAETGNEHLVAESMYSYDVMDAAASSEPSGVVEPEADVPGPEESPGGVVEASVVGAPGEPPLPPPAGGGADEGERPGRRLLALVSVLLGTAVVGILIAGACILRRAAV